MAQNLISDIFQAVVLQTRVRNLGEYPVVVNVSQTCLRAAKLPLADTSEPTGEMNNCVLIHTPNHLLPVIPFKRLNSHGVPKHGFVVPSSFPLPLWGL